MDEVRELIHKWRNQISLSLLRSVVIFIGFYLLDDRIAKIIPPDRVRGAIALIGGVLAALSLWLAVKIRAGDLGPLGKSWGYFALAFWLLAPPLWFISSSGRSFPLRNLPTWNTYTI